MKQSKDAVQKGNTQLLLPITDGQSFVICFPASAYKIAKSLEINLYFKNQYAYTSTFNPSGDESVNSEYVKNQSASRSTFNPSRDESVNDDDAMLVVRIDKITHSRYKTYINDRFIRDGRCLRYDINPENRVDTAGIAIDTTETVPITLTVFQYAEYGKVEAAAQAMRNPKFGDVEMENEGQVLKGSETEPDADGADSTNSSSVRARPLDADRMRYSSAIAWPIAFELECKDVKDSVQQKHDKMMWQWVVERGNNALLSTHEYFAYSHKVAWPSALSTVSVTWRGKIQERHTQLFKNLP
ncbi:hypothetical protein GALMADRAFT_160520 [Galerina marginata CBS 339.88]|uniref:Uncharacterized protein n=1 Tax=Galerina marginata (strain CBS 339.88) TaxID=685588 RepID=A0A067SGS4_GALM3|nr:hypothetical protein GALMADRAFT_160520 [Galerina marginata CBS 339.88]